MALIEGVGDEVTFLLAALLGLAVLLLAWVSTRTPDPNLGQEREGGGERQEETPGPSSSSSVASDSSTEAPPPAEAPPLAVGGAGKPEVGEEGVRHRGGGEERNIVLRLKFLNDTERTTTVRPDDTVGDIKRSVLMGEESVLMGEESRVRLIFQGQLLRDDSASVSSLGLSHLSVLHCHISANQGPGQRAGEGPRSPGGPASVGALMGPLFLLMLLLLWLCQFQYRQLFSPPATALLVMVTMVISVVVYRVYRG